jgi:hypothetical protein
MHHHSIQFVLLLCSRQGQDGGIDDVVGEFHESVVLVAEAFEVELDRGVVTRRMLGWMRMR